jgi:thiol-disulfide isomerase/thioredoxin
VKSIRILVVLVVVLLVATSCRGRQDSEAPLPSGDESAPDFTLPDLKGTETSLSQFRGKVVFINFWATWCGYCRDEMPDLDAFQKEYDGDVVVLAIALDDPSTVEAFVQEGGFSFRVLLDPQKATGKAYGVRYLPTTVVVDASGRIVEEVVGMMTRESMEAMLERALD